MRWTRYALALGLFACQPKDDRIPKQGTPPAPTQEESAAAQPADTPEAPQDAWDEGLSLWESPDFANAAHLKNTCDRALAEAASARTALKADAGDAEKTLQTFDQLERHLDATRGYAQLLFNVSPAEDVRQAAQDCSAALSKFASEISLDTEIYSAIAGLETDGLDAPTQYYIARNLRSFKLAGVDRDEETRARIAEIQEQLVALGQSYSKNVNADTRSIQVPAEALQGLPEDWIAAHPLEDGLATVTTDYPDLIPFLTYSESTEARRALANASAARGYPKNAEILKDVLKLRHELATLVGFESYAELNLADKMAGETAVVDSFLSEARQAVTPRLERDLAELLKRKQQDDPEATTVEVEDRFYLMQLIRKEKYDFDAKEAREYFAYNKVRDGIFKLYSELFEVTFEPVDGAATWHPSVERWNLLEDGEVVASFFLDMHPRDNKYKHAAMFPLQTGLSKDNRKAWASLVCNFPDPAQGDALMDHNQVVTFFHEFGHLIHHLLAQKSPLLGTSGIAVEWDFVETPSQLLEEWARDYSILKTFALNRDGEAIPESLVQAMNRAEGFGKGVELQRQLFYTAYSLKLHQVTDVDNLDLDSWTTELYQDWSPYPRPEEDRLYANFAHLIGYRAAYYTYQWSLSLAKDLFTEFKKAGLTNAEIARRYRDTILKPGGTAPAKQLVHDFLGREHNLNAYRDWIVD